MFTRCMASRPVMGLVFSAAIRRDGVEVRNETKIQVAAFTDPNDIPSYRLTKDHVDERRATLVNVIVSNDWTYLPGSDTIGLERSDTARCDYRVNSKVRAMVAVGDPGTEGNTWRDVAKRVKSSDESGRGK